MGTQHATPLSVGKSAKALTSQQSRAAGGLSTKLSMKLKCQLPKKNPFMKQSLSRGILATVNMIGYRLGINIYIYYIQQYM